MIIAAAFCPHPPALVAGVAGVRTGELDELRAKCADAIGHLTRSGVPQLVIIGSGPSSSAYSPVARGSLHGFGIDLEVHLGNPGCGGSVELPLSLTVGAWLLEQSQGPRSGALGFAAGAEFASSRAALDLLALAERSDIGLLVMGDGSARRSVAAPGYLDAAAAAFDESVSQALGTGDGDALSDLDLVEGERLLAAGVPAWRAAGALLAGDEFDARLLYDQSPYGVGYFVASWAARG